MSLAVKTYLQNLIWTTVKSQLTVQQRDTSKILIDRARGWTRDHGLGVWGMVYGCDLSRVFFRRLFFILVFLGSSGTSLKVITWALAWTGTSGSLGKVTFLGAAFLGHVIQFSTIKAEFLLEVSIFFCF